MPKRHPPAEPVYRAPPQPKLDPPPPGATRHRGVRVLPPLLGAGSETTDIYRTATEQRLAADIAGRAAFWQPRRRKK